MVRPGGAAVAVFFLLAGAVACLAVSRDAYENNKKGVEAMAGGRYQNAIEYFRNAVNDAPEEQVIRRNLSNAYNNYGVALMKNGNLPGAQENLERAVQYNPKNAYALLGLGQAYYKSSRTDLALRYLNEAHNVKPDIPGLADFLDKVRRESAVETNLKKVELSHFTIVSSESLGTDGLADVKIALDNAYARVGALLDYFPQEKVVVVVYPEADFARLSGSVPAGQPGMRPAWAHAVFDGKIRLPAAKERYTKDALRKILYHEYAHALIRMLAKGNCPLWLNEGLACYAEGLVQPHDRSFFAPFITRATFVPLGKLPSSYDAIKGAWEANLFYREFYLVASYCIDRYGSTSVRQCLGALGRGTTVNDAFRAAFGVSMDEMERSWASYVFAKTGA
ncbi:MAG: peptidase MA family metallohydrolase [Candidatus Omnitrophica bacterium]|nr:peptidase MA family metallohydrolase [Candidatus Omnitrophota bacterium]